MPPIVMRRDGLSPSIPNDPQEPMVRSSSDTLIQSFTHPPGKVYLIHGDRTIFSLSLTMASAAIARGASIAVVDGGNRFDAHLIARFAREHRIDPSQLLSRIFISRGFTCYQMEQAITGRLPAFLRSRGATTAMIFNPLETFYDQQAPFREVQHILVRVLRSLEQMKREGISVLLACLDRTLWPEERNRLFPMLASGVDRTFRLAYDEQQHAVLELEQSRSPSLQPSSIIHPSSPSGQGEHHGTHRTNIHQHHRQ